MSFSGKDNRFDCYYIHDMITTTIKNRDLSRYCSRNHVDVKTMPQRIREHIISRPSESMEVVALQCYECDRAGLVNQTKKHVVTVIGQTYSHYVRDDEKGDIFMRTSEEDSYDFRAKTFKTLPFRKESFFTEHESNKRVIELFDNGFVVKGNMHKFINEFCYDLYEGFDEKDFKGRLIEKPEGCRFPLLSSSSNYIGDETVVFGSAKSLRVVDDSHIKTYSYEHKTLAFDIETVLVDEHGKKIGDQIIQVSLVYQEGKHIHRIIGITIDTADKEPSNYDFSHMCKFTSNERLPDVEIYCVRNEKELIEKIIEVCVDVKPDYLAGYNCLSFDIPVLLKSADRHKIDLFEAISHLSGFLQNKASLERDLRAYRIRQQNEDISTLEDNRCFDLSYQLFPGVLVNDLFRVHSGEKLDSLAKTSLGFGKEDVSYVEIPRMFYSKQSSDRTKLLKYNIVDSLLCSLLLNTDDNFRALSFFTMCTSLFKVPHSQFFNNQKMAMIVPIFYNSYRKENMLQDMRIKPARENNRRSIAQVIKFFLYDDQEVSLQSAQEWLFKFSTGTVKTKTIVKHFDLTKTYGDLDRVDFSKALEILDEQISQARVHNSKHGQQFYTLTHLMLLLRFLGEPRTMEGFDTKGFVSDYMKRYRLGRHAPVDVGKRSKKANNILEREEELISELISFLRYLSRRFIASSHTIEDLVSDYVAFEQLDSKFKQQVEHFGTYLNDNEKGKLGDKFVSFIRMLSKRSGRRKRFADRHTSETFCQEVYNRISGHFLEKFYEPFKYDGAYIYLPNPGVTSDKPVNCTDFTSLYPHLGVEHNVGKHTQISRQTIIDNNLRENEDYTVHNIFTRDDFRDVDLNELDDQEARQCFRFYLTKKHATSVYAKTWSSIIALRLHFKRQIGKFDNDKENQMVEEKSNTFKIVINSIYGVLSLLGEWQISAVITGSGRQYVQSVGHYLEKHRAASLVYGDSVMPYTPLTLRVTDGNVKVTTFEQLEKEVDWKPYREFKTEDQITMWDKEQGVSKTPIEVFTSSGWKPVRRIVRHKTAKKIHRIVTRTGIVDVTEDHSLIAEKGELMRPRDASVGTKLLQIHREETYVNDPRDTGISPDYAYVLGVFVGAGHCDTCQTTSGIQATWKISSTDLTLLNKCKDILKKELSVDSVVVDTMEPSKVYKLVPASRSHRSVRRLAIEFRTACYSGESKVVPDMILQASSKDVLKAFHDGLCDSDGKRKELGMQNSRRIDTENQISAHTFVVLFKRLQFGVSLDSRRDQPQVYRITYSEHVDKKALNEVKNNYVLHENYKGVVYDIETEDGTFNAGIGDIVLKNTDSVMFHLNMTTTELCDRLNDGELLKKGWIKKEDCSFLQQYAEDSYKQGCLISSVISKRAVDELNDLHMTSPATAIYKPPSKLEHEKTMLPFVIFRQKKYFARIVDAKKADSFIVRGLEARKRTRILATEQVENMMCSELLQRRSSSWKTFQLASEVVSSLLNETVDLKTISSRQKVTVTSSRLNSKKSDAGIDLFRRMIQRGEIVDTGGLDKISIDVIKVINRENKSKVKLESLEYLEKLRRDNRPLELDCKSIVNQILKEVVTIMSIVHPRKTYQFYLNLLDLKLSPEAIPTDFEEFSTTGQTLLEKVAVQRANKTLNSSIYSYVDVVDNAKTSPGPSKSTKRASTSVSEQPRKKLKQTMLAFSIKPC